jgi:hypothetical protein
LRVLAASRGCQLVNPLSAHAKRLGYLGLSGPEAEQGERLVVIE